MENRKSYVGMKMTILFLFLFGVFAPSNSTFAAVLTTKDLVTIMHTNDMHGRMEFMEDQYSPSIGLGRVKTFKNNEKPTVLVDAGDAMQGLPISNYSKGMDMVKAMNAVGYDAMTLGNHEFDFGLDTALAYQKELKFPIVSANVFYKDGTRPFKPYTIVEKDVKGTKKKFALIGLTTPETTTKTHPNNVEKIKFTKPAPAAIETIKEIGDKADYFVFMTHLGIDETTVEDETSTHLATELAKNFPNKKIFIADGHSHTELPEGMKADNILIGQTGNHLNNVGMMTGDYTGTTPKLTAVLHPFSELKDLVPDPTVEGIVATAKANFDKEMSGVVLEDNKITFNGERANARTRETNLGNIIGDSLLSYGKTGFSEVSDFAIMNGGGIRQNIQAGKVTKGDIVGVMPFGNTVSQIKVTGNEVYGMFEHSLRSTPAKDDAGKVILDENGLPKLGANGGFLQVSDSIKITYDSNLQGAVPEENTAGKRVTSIQIKDKAGKFVDVPRNDTTTYNMVTNDFLAAGGDGYAMLAGKAVEQGPSMDEVFMEYLTGLSSTELAAYEVELPFTRIISKKSEVVVVTDEQDKLTTTIAKAEALNETDYTAESWAKLETALANAKTELAKKDEEKVKAANESLTKAIAELEKVVVSETEEQEKLAATIAKAEALNETDYTAESWAKLETALANAKTELAKKDEEKAKAANDSLTKAIAELEKVVVSETEEQEKLAATIEKAEALKKADYTAESWAKLETALKNAKTELAKKDEEKAKIANQVLTEAIDGLKKVSNTSKTPKQDALAKTIASLVKTDYTAHSWAAFEPTLTSAKTELAAKDETRADAANNKLINAKKQLVEVKSLKDLVTSSKKLKEADYTKATWTYFAKSLSDAESLLKKAESVKEEVTEQQISGAKSALEVSIKKLEKTGTNNSTNKKKYYSALPQTGEAETHYGALGLVVLGTTGVYIYRRKQDKDAA